MDITQRTRRIQQILQGVSAIAQRGFALRGVVASSLMANAAVRPMAVISSSQSNLVPLQAAQ